MNTAADRSWKASYYDGQTAGRHEATVSLARSGLYVSIGEKQTLWWLFERLRVAQGYHSGEPVRIETLAEIPEAVVVEDHDFLAAFLQFAPRGGSLAASATERLNRSVPLILTGLAAAAFVVFALWRWGIPAFAELAARRVPPSWEASLGESVMEQLAPVGNRCEDPEGLARINEIIARLRPQPAASSPITLAVVDAPVPNAFAAPGGYVAVFRGLLEQTENPEDLAGVLAHELQHVEQRHAMKGLVRQLSVASLLAVLVGDSSGVSSIVDAAAMLGAMKYQREDEERADSAGVRMLEAAGIDANGLPRMLDRMSDGKDDASDALQYLSSHPATTDRVHGLYALAARSGVAAKPLFEGYDWHDVAFMCGEPGEESSPALDAAPPDAVPIVVTGVGPNAAP